MQQRTRFTHLLLMLSLALALALTLTCGVPAVQAGFVVPADGITTVVANIFQFKGRADYIAPPAGQLNFFGGVLPWDPAATEVNQGGGMFSISVTGKHTSSPHGEAVPGPLLSLNVPIVVAGGAQQGTFMTSGFHGGHTDWLQVLFAPINANTSRLYVQLDHIDGVNQPLPLDPRTFDVPEPTAASGAIGTALFILFKRLRRSRATQVDHRGSSRGRACHVPCSESGRKRMNVDS
jgi:hypothetical protein